MSEADPRRTSLGTRLAGLLHARRSGMALMAFVVGIGAGIGALIFRWLITGFTLLFSGYDDYAAHPGAAHGWLPALGPYFVVLAPVVAGLLYGPIVQRFAPAARGHGVPEVMYAVGRKGGRIPPQVAAVKALASAICIGGGGSVGREGPIVQIGASLASSIGRIVRLPENRLKLLVACGSAGGIAATFNAPLAGCFFAMELILVNFSADTFGMVVISAFTASVVGRIAIGDHHMLTLPPFQLEHLGELWWVLVIGVVGGVAGVVFSKVLYGFEDAADAVWHGPEWLRPAVGGLVLGLFLLAVPEMYGVGYPVLGNAIEGRYPLYLLLIFMVAKVVGTSLTLAIGGSGGVFAPSLFVGAMLGGAFGTALHTVQPAYASEVGVYAVLGMGAVFAGSARAPMTAILIIIELTREYDLILPLMIAVVLATMVSRFISRESIYTLKLHRRGDDLGSPLDQAALGGTPVAAIMDTPPAPLPLSASLREAARAFADSRYRLLPVTRDTDGPAGARAATDNGTDEYIGCASAIRVASALAEHPEGGTVADSELFTDSIDVEEPMAEVMTTMAETPMNGLPVVAQGRLVGWISQRNLIRRVYRHDQRYIREAQETSWEERWRARRTARQGRKRS